MRNTVIRVFLGIAVAAVLSVFGKPSLQSQPAVAKSAPAPSLETKKN